MEKRGVGLNQQAQTHYTDHVAPMCVIMGIPMIFIDEHNYALGSKYYPGLDAQFIPYEKLTREYLITHYDVFFMTDLWDKEDFHNKYKVLEKKYHKTLRNVHCPHGFSDKGFYLKKCVNEDITLIYGQNMLDLLKNEGVLDKLKNYVISGNFRYTYFKQNRAFYDEIMAKEVLSHFPKKQPIILYAPTWLDMIDSTTFFDAHQYIIGNLPDSYNMIVKLHPRLEQDNNALFIHILAQYENKPNVLFLKDFPPIFPLLAHTDIYLSDMSSIGYDFLPFNRPMFFLNKQKLNPRTDRSLYLFRCGVEIKPDAYPLLYQAIDAYLPDDTKFTDIRNKVYQYTFGQERSFSDIKNDVIQVYSS